jgi:GR25 family glycosyltransferase involved in LPS biosynthesis
MSVGTQLKGTPDLRALVFLGSDVPDSALPVLQQKFPFASFERLPDSSPPPGAFEDFWAPEHYGWKLWIYNELNQRQDLSGRMIFYTDAGSFLCRWPKDWLLRAQANDVCLLEDPRQENRRWCSPEFCAALSPTAAELSAQQRLGGLVSFRAGSSRAKAFFSEAYSLAHQRNILVGPKWAGTTPEGLPYGHRHDQSILSLLSLRHGIATHPLDDVYCDHSLRKTFTTGRSLYVHRGNFTVHKPFAEGIDEAYVINLDRRKDRMERLWSNHPELNGRVERWPAIEGKNLRLTPALEGLLRPNDFFWKKAVTGCALSHLGLWWKLGHEHPDIQNYLILEDDVKFRPGWEEAWRKAVAAGDIPQDYDIIYLGGVLPPNRAGFEQFAKERVNDSFSRVKPNTLFNQTEPNRYFHFCAYAYVLSRSGAEKIMSLLEGAGGYWTSADHILCNPVTVLRSYFLDPLVAGCYQDDDPKYANSEFNNFSRIDEFDSDLWNNDERFTPEEIAAVAAPEGTPINIPQALLDARQPPTTTVEVQQTIGRVAPAQATVELRKELSTPKVKGNPIKLVGRRIVALAEQGLHFKDLYESNWLLDLFGRPSMLEVTSIQPRDPPPTDEPIVIFQRPHVEKLTAMLEKWDSFGAKFRILHLSDEFGTDPISAYDLSGCTSVLRIYLRPDAVTHPKVTTIPLGYHWTLLEGSKDAVNLTPHLPFRQQDWTFFGTVWNDRQRLLQPLTEIPGIRYAAQFFHQWNDSNCLKQEEYIGALLNSIFVPCPDGMNPETFRFYEALDCGAVPLLVRTQKNAAWVDWVSEHLGLLPLSSWDEAAKLVEQLLQQKPLLEQYREKVLMAWEAWKKALRGSVGHWLQGEAQ